MRTKTGSNPGLTRFYEFRSHAPVSRALCRLVTSVIAKMAYQDGLLVAMLLCGRRKGLVTTVMWRCIFTDFIDVQSRYVWALGASTNAEFAYSALFCVTVGWQMREDFPGCLTWLLYVGGNCRRWRFAIIRMRVLPNKGDIARAMLPDLLSSEVEEEQ